MGSPVEPPDEVHWFGLAIAIGLGMWAVLIWIFWLIVR